MVKFEELDLNDINKEILTLYSSVCAQNVSSITLKRLSELWRGSTSKKVVGSLSTKNLPGYGAGKSFKAKVANKICVHLVLWGFFKEVREEISTAGDKTRDVYYVRPDTSNPLNLGSDQGMSITMMIPTHKRSQEEHCAKTTKKKKTTTSHHELLSTESVSSRPLLPAQKSEELIDQLGKLTKSIAATATIVKQDGVKVKCKHA